MTARPMTERNAVHATFCVERVYAASPARVFSAFADPEKKAKWFKGPDEWGPADQKYDFRVGGEEHSIGGPPGEPPHRFYNRYLEIIPNERIVYAYWMHHGDPLASASIATIEFRLEGEKTRVVMTEVGVFVDGYYSAEGREEGTQWLLEKIAPLVEG
ncbi:MULTISPECIES: SRPBCC family protein [unclassified Caulobacter]|uniref:SRPBCC family protein n=1 Tax=unclassified Caulobacter TaxID=2648921 RepID=UPI000B2AC15C|nr:MULTISPECIES: SRPBCC family protein [unclassified Caulobacter]